VLPEDGTLVSKHVGVATLIFIHVYVEFNLVADIEGGT